MRKIKKKLLGVYSLTQEKSKEGKRKTVDALGMYSKLLKYSLPAESNSRMHKGPLGAFSLLVVSSREGGKGVSVVGSRQSVKREPQDRQSAECRLVQGRGEGFSPVKVAVE